MSVFFSHSAQYKSSIFIVPMRSKSRIMCYLRVCKPRNKQKQVFTQTFLKSRSKSLFDALLSHINKIVNAIFFIMS